MSTLKDKVCLVTGGLSGIGRAISELLATQGARVTVVDMSTESRDDGMTGDDFIRSLPTDSMFLIGDVGEEGDVDRIFDETADRYGRLDVLINNAGITVFRPLQSLSIDDFDRVMRTNVRGPFLCARRAAAKMRRQPEKGVIVNVASNFAFVGATDGVAYCTSKGAVVSLTQALAVELGPDAIRVNALCPGATATEFNRAHRDRPEISAEWERMTPLRDADGSRFLATPEEIARSALFLAAESSAFMTGSALVIDGGWNAQ